MSVEALQKRIKTTLELRDIVSNMKTLSSVSIWQYEQANRALEKYRHNLRQAFHALALNGGLPEVFQNDKATDKYLYILVGSDNGMVGKFNKDIIDQVRLDIKAKKLVRQDVLCLIVGRRLIPLAEHAGLNIYQSLSVSNSVKSVGNLAESVLLKIDETVQKKRINHVIVCYHRKQGNTTVVMEKKQMIPYDKSLWKNLHNKKWDTNNLPMVPPNHHKMFAALLNETLMITIIRFLNSSLVAEHFTRMTNMQEAEKNIDENLEKMNLEYQQQRQENITDELIDVISGAEAMCKKIS